MKTKLFFFALFICCLLGCSNSEPPTELSKIAALRPTQTSKINSIRLNALQQTARGLGAQAGLAWRSRNINKILITQKRKFDQIYNFNYLLLPHNVLPPVLAEGRNTLNLADEYTLRISDRYYEIVYPPRFVTSPPTWRDYIWMNYKKPESPNATMLPQNSEERKVWNEYIQIGWNDGIRQADEIFSANLSRLKRDYEGMILYKKLLAQNMVTPPYVSQADLGVTGGGDAMAINDRVLRITAVSQLQANSKRWNPIVAEKKGKSKSELLDQYKNLKTK